MFRVRMRWCSSCWRGSLTTLFKSLPILLSKPTRFLSSVHLQFCLSLAVGLDFGSYMRTYDIISYKTGRVSQMRRWCDSITANLREKKQGSGNSFLSVETYRDQVPVSWACCCRRISSSTHKMAIWQGERGLSWRGCSDLGEREGLVARVGKGCLRRIIP